MTLPMVARINSLGKDEFCFCKSNRASKRHLSSVHGDVILTLIPISRDKRLDESELIVSRQIPKQLAQRAEGFPACFCAAQASAWFTNFDRNAEQFAVVAACGACN